MDNIGTAGFNALGQIAPSRLDILFKMSYTSPAAPRLMLGGLVDIQCRR